MSEINQEPLPRSVAAQRMHKLGSTVGGLLTAFQWMKRHVDRLDNNYKDLEARIVELEKERNNK
jgi:hypothetical protein